MSAIVKDGNVYRTEYEQIVHLTEKHNEQIEINKNVSRQLQDLSVSANLGGYNYVRFAFNKNGTFYRFKDEELSTSIASDVNDYFEVFSGNERDIPAYGYYNGHNVILSENGKGDFIANYPTLTLRNVTKNIEETISIFELEVFGGTSLLDYNPQVVKRQLFNILEDLSYNRKTQYVSFDLNKDDVYNFVFVGVISDGADGKSIRPANNQNIETVKMVSKSGDSILFVEDMTEPLYVGSETPLRGDVFIYQSSSSIVKSGSILGEKGEKGDKGDKGDQGIQGVQGIQGNQGIQGVQGVAGQTNPVFRIMDFLDNPQDLPPFSSAIEGDAYIVTKTTGATISYDLYFKTVLGDNWNILPNWGVERPSQGIQGPIGPQGIQGVQGIQGEKGERGASGGIKILYSHNIRFNARVNSNRTIVFLFQIISDKSTAYNFGEIANYFSNFEVGDTIPVNGWEYVTISGETTTSEVISVFRLHQNIYRYVVFNVDSNNKFVKLEKDFNPLTITSLDFKDNVREI